MTQSNQNSTATDAPTCDVKLIAIEFSKLMAASLSPRDLEQVNKANAKACIGSRECESHHYVDSNMLMVQALEALGFPFDPASDDQADIINSAWSMAKASSFSATTLIDSCVMPSV